MTAPSTASRGLDPRRSAKYTVHIGGSLQNDASRRSGGNYTGVKLNHKPGQVTDSRTATISASDDGGHSMSIEDDDAIKPADGGTYTYRGSLSRPKRQYVLIFDENRPTCTLEPLAETYTFNLHSSPWETSAAKLAKRYPHARPPSLTQRGQSSDSDSDELVEDGAGDDTAATADEPDPSNPFDIRHFLHSGRGPASSSPSPPNGTRTATVVSAVNTPRAGATGTTPLTQVSRGTKPAAAAPKKPRALPTSRKRKSPSPVVEERPTPVPQVRIDRRASTRGTEAPAIEKQTKKADTVRARSPPAQLVASSDDDGADGDRDGSSDEDRDDDTGGGALTIDFGDDDDRRGRQTRDFGLGIADAAGGPISLRSAANSASPASRLATPQHGRRAYDDDDDDGDVLTFGDADVASESDEEMGEDEREEDGQSADEDVDPIELGPPAHARGVADQPAGENDVEDEDDDFAAELMLGLQNQQEEDAAPARGVVESESESEEE